LERLRDAADPLAWDEFFRRYWRLIYRFARERGCSQHSAEDIVQEVMLAVFQQRELFRYDPARGRFRDWLATVVRNLIVRRWRQPAARIRAGEEAMPLAELEAAQPPPEAAWETAFEEAMLGVVLEIVRREVAPETFQAFELLVLHQYSGAETARITGLSRNAAYLARRRVLARLRELGAACRDGGRLDEQLRRAASALPDPAIERSVSGEVEKSMTKSREQGDCPDFRAPNGHQSAADQSCPSVPVDGGPKMGLSPSADSGETSEQRP
jgi:RNA polymerase sigma factor (sigma-70 family)